MTVLTGALSARDQVLIVEINRGIRPVRAEATTVLNNHGIQLVRVEDITAKISLGIRPVRDLINIALLSRGIQLVRVEDITAKISHGIRPVREHHNTVVNSHGTQLAQMFRTQLLQMTQIADQQTGVAVIRAIATVTKPRKVLA